MKYEVGDGVKLKYALPQLNLVANQDGSVTRVLYSSKEYEIEIKGEVYTLKEKNLW